MQTKEHSLCFTGHRSEKLPKTEEGIECLKQRLLAEIDKAIENGIDTFYMGACYGFDLLAAQMVLMRKKVISLNEPRQNPIKLIAVVPFAEQASRWCEKDREQYFDCTLPYCDEVITLNARYNQGCYHERNRYCVADIKYFLGDMSLLENKEMPSCCLYELNYFASLVGEMKDYEKVQFAGLVRCTHG